MSGRDMRYYEFPLGTGLVLSGSKEMFKEYEKWLKDSFPARFHKLLFKKRIDPKDAGTKQDTWLYIGPVLGCHIDGEEAYPGEYYDDGREFVFEPLFGTEYDVLYYNAMKALREGTASEDAINRALKKVAEKAKKPYQKPWVFPLHHIKDTKSASEVPLYFSDDMMYSCYEDLVEGLHDVLDFDDEGVGHHHMFRNEAVTRKLFNKKGDVYMTPEQMDMIVKGMRMKTFL